jgi:hypothetical protein
MTISQRVVATGFVEPDTAQFRRVHTALYEDVDKRIFPSSQSIEFKGGAAAKGSIRASVEDRQPPLLFERQRPVVENDHQRTVGRPPPGAELSHHVMRRDSQSVELFPPNDACLPLCELGQTARSQAGSRRRKSNDGHGSRVTQIVR